MDSSSTRLLALALLVLGLALLVVLAAAEAGITAISRSRIRQFNGLASVLNSYIAQRHTILRSLSLGMSTMTVLITATLAYLLLAGTELRAGALALAAVLAAALVSVARQSVRTIVLLDPEGWGVRLTRPINVLHALFTPLAWLVNLPVDLLLRAFGRRPRPSDEVDPAEELLALVEPNGHVEPTLAEERRMIRGVLEMSGQTVRELMTSRMDLTAISTDATLHDAVRVIGESGYSRIPLYEESLDRIVGVIYAKDVLAYLRTGDVVPSLREIARPPYFVPESKRANELLADMRRDQVHMAIAVDEYGGTAGVVTVEDLVEEIVGEITDEYDIGEVDVQQVSDDEAIVDARLAIDELNDLFGSEIQSEDFDTVGGLVFTLLGRLAVPGDEVVARANEEDDDDERVLRLRVLSIIGRRIKKVRVTREELARAADGRGERSEPA